MPTRKGELKKGGGDGLLSIFEKLDALERSNVGLGQRHFSNQVIQHYF